jgi:hypothetical protein
MIFFKLSNSISKSNLDKTDIWLAGFISAVPLVGFFLAFFEYIDKVIPDKPIKSKPPSKIEKWFLNEKEEEI